MRQLLNKIAKTFGYVPQYEYDIIHNQLDQLKVHGFTVNKEALTDIELYCSEYNGRYKKNPPQWLLKLADARKRLYRKFINDVITKENK